MSEKNVAIAEEYVIFQQDLTKDYLQLKPMGTASSISQARAICKLFNETDGDVKKGIHTYIISCTKVKGGDVDVKCESCNS